MANLHILCRMGFHKWKLRELHATEPVVAGKTTMKMAILERCSCGAGRVAPGGKEMDTMTGLVVPTKFMP